MILYLYCTKDKYRLPLAVADSKTELSKMIGIPLETVSKQIRRVMLGKTKNSCYAVVRLEDDDL